MEIRKLFKFESSHIVRGCSTRRCSRNNHGHSGKLEVFFTADGLDNGGMIIDFGLLKDPIGTFIDRFDHAWHYWDKENPEIIKAIHNINERWIQLPFTPSAENYSLFFLVAVNDLLKKMKFKNGERNVKCSRVRYHETDTGYAESTLEDLEKFKPSYDLEDVVFSDGILNENVVATK